MTIRAILFDLDGAFADAAPDLVAVFDRIPTEDGRAYMPFAVDPARWMPGAVARRPELPGTVLRHVGPQPAPTARAQAR